jgi:hypothetical protein
MTSTYMGSITFLSALEDTLATLGCSWQIEKPGKCLKCSCSGTLRAVRWGRRTRKPIPSQAPHNNTQPDGHRLTYIVTSKSYDAFFVRSSTNSSLGLGRPLAESQPIISDTALYLEGPFDIVGNVIYQRADHISELITSAKTPSFFPTTNNAATR